MYSSVTVPRNLTRLACICRRASTAVDSSKIQSDGITPPPRIKRGPTDLLQALAATVSIDPTAAHYKYHDDPYLIPTSNYRKRSYALSAESGRKAAVWIRDQHPELFTERVWDPPTRTKTPHFNADPQIPAFAPRPVYTDESKVTEEDLKMTIQNALVEDSIKIYQLLGGSSALTPELRLSLLQLLCFYNERQADSEWVEERWYATAGKERRHVSWKLGGLAEEIFTSLEEKDSIAYCSLIQGMAKYYQAERAHALAVEAEEAGLKLSVGCYNALLGCVGFLKEGVALRTEALTATLRRMDAQGISPNSETLSSCLRSVSAWGGGNQLCQLAKQLLAEFKIQGIVPSLAAYYHLLKLFCKERGPRTDILSCILADLETRPQLEPQEADDTSFFITALGVCSDHLQDMQMAERVHTLLMKDDNYKLVGDAYKESIYYRHLVTVACRRAPVESLTELLDTLVPNIYVPEPSAISEIIRALEVGGCGDRLAQCWSQLVMFGHASRVNLQEQVLAAMCACYTEQGEDVKTQMRLAAADIIKHGEITDLEQQQKDQRSPKPSLSANGVSDAIALCTAAPPAEDGCWESALVAATKLSQGEVAGVPERPAILVRASELAARAGQHSLAAVILTYLAEFGFEEAKIGCIQTLSTVLGRSESEVQELLSSKTQKELASSLHPAALQILEAYQVASVNTVASRSSGRDSSDSSDSGDSDSSDSEHEKNKP